MTKKPKTPPRPIRVKPLIPVEVREDGTAVFAGADTLRANLAGWKHLAFLGNGNSLMERDPDWRAPQPLDRGT